MIHKIKKSEFAKYYGMSVQNMYFYKTGSLIKQRKYKYLHIGYEAYMLGLKFLDIQKWVLIIHKIESRDRLISDKILANILDMTVRNIDITYKRQDAKVGKKRMYTSYRIGVLCDLYQVTSEELIVISQKKENSFFLKSYKVPKALPDLKNS